MKTFQQIILFVSILCCFSEIVKRDDGCFCSPNQTITPANPSFTFGSPTTTGTFDGANCAANCSTIINLANDVDANHEYGIQINMLQCANLSRSNILTIYEDQNIFKIFGSCPSNVYKNMITYPHIYTFSWNLVTPVQMIVFGQPSALAPSTPPTTPLTYSTPTYSGPFISDPTISRMDLTISLDTNSANIQFFNNSREVITNIVKYFTYSSDFVRLSFMTFDPYAAAGTGKYPLWSLNGLIVAQELNNMPFYPGNASRYAEVLDTFFFNKLGDFPLRNNTERIFIIVTGTDSSPASDNFAKIKTEINAFDIKFLFINMNTNVTTKNSTNFPYPNLKKITGTLSNQAHWFDYQINQNNAENFLTALYFDGNTLCSRPTGNPRPLIPNDIPIYYSIPQDPTKLYCNYMDNTQTYINTNSAYTISVTINKYDLKNTNDVLIIAADGKEIAQLKNYGTNVRYCLQNKNVTVTLKTKNGQVFNGYQSHVSAMSFKDCNSTILNDF